ncbi:MAG: redoxin domain-containing protein [Gammaproteobacteria bacterium]
MTELGELESHFQEFKNRKSPVNIVAISMDAREDAQKSQAQFPHLTVVADTDRKMCHTLNVMHPGAGPGGEDAVAPTTILVDGQGTVRWLFRPDRFLTRLSPAQLLAAIDEHMPAQ